MEIAASDVVLSSSHAATQTRVVTESLRAWVGDKRPDFEGRAGQGAPTAAAVQRSADVVQISDSGKELLAAQAAASQAAQASQDIAAAADDIESDPKMQLIKSLLEFMTGNKISLMHSSDLAVPVDGGGQAAPAQAVGAAAAAPVATAAVPRAGYGIEYDRHESYSESEQSNFQASGVIRTADNQEIKFDISLQMARDYHVESNISERRGDARKIDPLVINFSGKAAELTDQRFAFDLNADGKSENLQFVKGSGFLALDRNQDGVINNGSELFGPTTGDGFGELAALDSDHNGWIDEKDPAYAQLRIFNKDASGADHLQSLKQADVGAVMVGSIATPFAIKDAQNNLQAQVRAAGVWLSEQGRAGTVQQIDLVA